LAIDDQLLRLRPQLVGYARAICGNSDEADDLVQDAIERALIAPAPPTAISDLRPWMFTVIRNLHIDERRKFRVRTEYAGHQIRLVSEQSHKVGDPLQDLLVRKAFEGLSPEHREIVYLVDVMGMRYSEAGEILAIPQGTVMSRLSRARRAIIDQLNESNVEPLRRRERK
jgi:RNA polymerase sigma factor (sigma-70 family)